MRIIPVEIGDEGGNVENEILLLPTDLTRTVIGFMAVVTTCLKSGMQNVTSLSLQFYLERNKWRRSKDIADWKLLSSGEHHIPQLIGTNVADKYIIIIFTME